MLYRLTAAYPAQASLHPASVSSCVKWTWPYSAILVPVRFPWQGSPTEAGLWWEPAWYCWLLLLPQHKKLWIPCPLCERLMICLRPMCPHSYFRVGHNNRCNLSPHEQSLLKCYLRDSNMGIPNMVFIGPDGLCVLNVCVELLLPVCCFSVVVTLFLRQSLTGQTGFRLTV